MYVKCPNRSAVKLGFVEVLEETLAPNDFPSKVGGKPVHTLFNRFIFKNASFLATKIPMTEFFSRFG
jgi:hypothetical protein